MKHAVALGVRGARRLSGFTISMILQAIASLVLVPATIGAAGLEIWSSIVLAQALALVAATVVSLGYPVTGPAVVATQPFDSAINYFRLAERTRFVVAVPCFAVMAGAMFAIPNPDPIAGLLGGSNLAIGAFSGWFFYVGRGAPTWLLWAETGPRVSLTIAGALSLTLGAPLLIGLALPVVGTAIAIALSNISIRMSGQRTNPNMKRPISTSVLAELRNQLAPAASSLLRGGRDALPVLMVTAVAADLIGAYGVFDRVGRQANNALTPVTATLQGWVPRRMAADANARPAVAAAVAGVAVAAVIFVSFMLLGGPLIRWLAAGTLRPTFAEILLLGAAIAINMLMQVINNACLVPLGGIRAAILSNLTGITAICISLTVLLLHEKSLVWALSALVSAYVIQLFMQLLLMRHYIARGANLVS